VDFELRDFETPAVSGVATVPVTIDLLTAISRKLLYRLLTSEQGARLRQIISFGSRSNRTAKAIAWLKANFQKTLRVESLAEYAGMAISTFHRHFRAMTRVSSLQYQEQLLHEAIGLDPGTAAFHVGSDSAAQFSREYSRVFGRPPLRDIKALRFVCLTVIRRRQGPRLGTRSHTT
jgi:transcriptional regulator GlxA family with amidase domain